jgi:hypothetical protein
MSDEAKRLTSQEIDAEPISADDKALLHAIFDKAPELHAVKRGGNLFIGGIETPFEHFKQTLSEKLLRNRDTLQ